MEEQIKADEGDFVGLMFLLLESLSELSISAMLSPEVFQTPPYIHAENLVQYF